MLHRPFSPIRLYAILVLLVGLATTITTTRSSWAEVSATSIGGAIAGVYTCNDAGSICRGQSFEGNPLVGGGANASAAGTFKGEEGSANSSLMVTTSGDGVLISGNTQVRVTDGSPSIRVKAQGTSWSSSSLTMNIPEPATVTVEVGLSGSVESGGIAELDVYTYVQNRYTPLSITTLICPPGETTCSRNDNRQFSISVIPGQAIYVTGMAAASIFNISASSRAVLNASVRVIEKKKCDHAITGFTANRTTITPSAGETITFTPSISGQYDSSEISITDNNGARHVVGATWDGRLGGVIKPGVYTATLTVRKAGCPDIAQGLSVTVKQECPTITSFTANKAGLAPESGEIVRFFPDINGQYDSLTIIMVSSKRVYTLPNPWNGRLGGRLPDPGTYTAVLVVEKKDCDPATKALPVTVKRNKEDCKLNVTIGSSANVASGGLTHSQPLFSTKGAGLNTSMSLYYNSVDPYDGPLGRGWTHDYSISIAENADGSVLVREPNGVRRLYKVSGGAYVPPPGEYSTLVKNGDTFALTHKDGITYHFNATGNIASMVDRNGNAMTFAYTGGNLTSITDPAGRTTALSYNADNRISAINDPSGNVHTFTYRGNLTGVPTSAFSLQSGPTPTTPTASCSRRPIPWATRPPTPTTRSIG